MKRYLIPILIVLLIIAGILYIPDIISTSGTTTTTKQTPNAEEQVKAKQRSRLKAELAEVNQQLANNLSTRLNIMNDIIKWQEQLSLSIRELGRALQALSTFRSGTEESLASLANQNIAHWQNRISQAQKQLMALEEERIKLEQRRETLLRILYEQ